MTSAAFDTLTTARKLEAAGVERRQAEAHAEALREAVSTGREQLATKADLKAELAALETRLTWRLLAVGGFVVAAVVAAVTFIPPPA